MTRSFNAWVLPDSVNGTEARAIHVDGGRATPSGAAQVLVQSPDATPEWTAGVLGALEAARLDLIRRPAGAIASQLGAAGARFLEPDDPIRAEALALLPGTAGISPQMAEVVLDGMAADWTVDRLTALLQAEFGALESLDGFATRAGQRSMPLGPRLTGQFVSGSVPGVSVTALVRALLVKSPTFVKPGYGDVVLPVLFARALREIDPALANAVAVVYWPGGSVSNEDVVLERAEMVTAYGGDEAVSALRSRASVSTRFRAYHHRTSVGFVGRSALARAGMRTTADEVARAVAMFDQRGCVSPQVVFVEDGGEGSAVEFSRELATSLRSLEAELPGGPLDPAEVSAVQQLRGTAELMSAAHEGVECAHGAEASWTVVLDPDGELSVVGAGRVVQVRPIESAGDLAAVLEPVAPHLQTVGVAGLGQDREVLAEELGRIGASRVVPFAQVAFPPAWWHHDGGGPLRDLVRHVDLSG